MQQKGLILLNLNKKGNYLHLLVQYLAQIWKHIALALSHMPHCSILSPILPQQGLDDPYQWESAVQTKLHILGHCEEEHLIFLKEQNV